MGLEPLVKICHEVGRKIPHWIQGTGGNISYKDGDTLWVKASGARLDAVGPTATLAKVGLTDIRKKLLGLNQDEVAYKDLLVSFKDGGWGRPSMEAGFHALLPEKWVVHFHSLCALLIAHHARKDPKKMLAWLGAELEGTTEIIPFCIPGLSLSMQLYSLRNTKYFILENHGVVIQSGNDKELLGPWKEMERKFCDAWGYSDLLAEPKDVGAPLRIYFPDTAVFLERLRKFLQPHKNGLCVMQGAADRDVVEIWRATELLYAACPELPEIPEDAARVIANLPTEQFRRKGMRE